MVILNFIIWKMLLPTWLGSLLGWHGIYAVVFKRKQSLKQKEVVSDTDSPKSTVVPAQEAAPIPENTMAPRPESEVTQKRTQTQKLVSPSRKSHKEDLEELLALERSILQSISDEDEEEEEDDV